MQTLAVYPVSYTHLDVYKRQAYDATLDDIDMDAVKAYMQRICYCLSLIHIFNKSKTNDKKKTLLYESFMRVSGLTFI